MMPTTPDGVAVFPGLGQDRQRGLAATRAKEACRVIGVIARVDGDVEDLFDRVASRLAAFDLHEVEQLLLAVEHQVVVAEEDRPAMLRAESRPTSSARSRARSAASATSSAVQTGTEPMASPVNGARTSLRSRAPGQRHRLVQPGDQRRDACRASRCHRRLARRGRAVKVGVRV